MTLERKITFDPSDDPSDAAVTAEAKVLEKAIAEAADALVLDGMARGLRPIGPLRITIAIDAEVPDA